MPVKSFLRFVFTCTKAHNIEIVNIATQCYDTSPFRLVIHSHPISFISVTWVIEAYLRQEVSAPCH
jgi:hypothetical protein